jgi:hypothetical protein
MQKTVSAIEHDIGHIVGGGINLLLRWKVL